MALRAIPVSYRNSNYKRVCRTMIEAFPETERMPMWVLRLLARRKLTKFNVILDEENFCGILYTVENRKYVFILYLAVSEEVRSKGYGSQILDFVKKNANGRNIVLHVEYPVANAENAKQRASRMRFYARNGILDTGYFFGEGDEKYAVLSSDVTEIDIESYKSLLRYMTFGFYVPKMERGCRYHAAEKQNLQEG